ncbi:hypothetical protein F5Y10DRAFT_290932 [Nemania abortiva]|nr:hypothetical protein F5Y10DRAFT_290932 [Nemania abortiva]
MILDGFFSYLVFGPNGTALEHMIGQENVDTLMESVNALYKRYMVQVINSSIFRKPVNNSQPQDLPIFMGTATAAIPRLTVDFTSKLVLQIMLATMVVLEGLSLTQIKLRGLLPRNPCSIASTMGFLAGSKLCSKDFPLGHAEHMDERRLKETLAQYNFGMGWWRDTDSTLTQRTEEAEDLSRWRFGIDVGQPDRSGLLSKTRKEGKTAATRNA